MPHASKSRLMWLFYRLYPEYFPDRREMEGYIRQNEALAKILAQTHQEANEHIQTLVRGLQERNRLYQAGLETIRGQTETIKYLRDALEGYDPLGIRQRRQA